MDGNKQRERKKEKKEKTFVLGQMTRPCLMRGLNIETGKLFLSRTSPTLLTCMEKGKMFNSKDGDSRELRDHKKSELSTSFGIHSHAML